MDVIPYELAKACWKEKILQKHIKKIESIGPAIYHYYICPYHNDKKTHLVYSVKEDSFKCYECGMMGNGFKLAKKLKE